MLGAGRLASTDIEMITYQMEKRLLADKRTGAVDSMTIPKRLGLMGKVEPRPDGAGIVANHLGIGAFITWAHYQTDVINAGADNLFDENRED
jgi:hypothetical protein